MNYQNFHAFDCEFHRIDAGGYAGVGGSDLAREVHLKLSPPRPASLTQHKHAIYDVTGTSWGA